MDQPRKTPRMLAFAVGIIVVAVAIALFDFAWPDAVQRKADALRQDYAFDSLAGRLAFEEGNADQNKVPPLTPGARQRLEAQEQESYSRRTEALKMLHSAEVSKFITREGFGFRRVSPPDQSDLLLPAVEPIPFESTEDLSGEEELKPSPIPGEDGRWAGKAMPGFAMLIDFHDESRRAFLSPSTFGLANDHDRVAGFVAHHFREKPAMKAAPFVDPLKERWLIRRLELVSLLKGEAPAVYLSPNLPRMDDLKDARTRALNQFEDSALQSLRSGEDLRVEATSNRIAMVGSLRASTQCLKCHRGRSGRLLGAFSYELQRQPRHVTKE